MRRQEHIVLAVFLLAQALDGALTYAGVQRLGIEVEGNKLLAFYMEHFGVGLTIVGAKFLASVCGIVLYLTGSHRPLAAAAGGYLGFAIFPWMLVLA